MKQKISHKEPVNILMVDDQPAKLLSYEAILSELGENLIKANSGREALEQLLRNDVAVVLMDVSMPEIDGFELADIIRQHPRFQKTAIIFISAVHLTDIDRLRGYQRGAVDYISVPVVPEVLRAKVGVFAELHRKTHQLERLNQELELRVEERTCELADSERQFRTLADTIPQLCWMAHADGWIFWYNERWYEYTGTTEEQMKGWGWESVHHPEMIEEVTRRWKESLEAGRPFEMEFPLRGVDGVYRWFLTRAIPVLDSTGAVQRWFGTNTNIHEQRATRTALEVAQERLTMAQKAAGCGTFEWDARLDTFDCSPELLEISGFAAEDSPRLGNDWIACVLPEDREQLTAAVSKSLETGSLDTEFRFRRRTDGEIRWLSTRARATRDTDGKLLRMVGLSIDVTHMKRAEEELQRAHDELDDRVRERTVELRQAEENLRQLSGTLMRTQDEERRRIARELHDGLGQYLVAVKMSMDMVHIAADEPLEKRNEYLEEASRLVEHAIAETRTISHLLHPPLLDEIGLESALRWYGEGFAKRSGIAVNIEISPQVGRLESETETAIFRVVQECLTNIHRHSGSATASLRLFREAGEIGLEIRDTGKGFPPHTGNGAGASPRPGIGIEGMRERVRQLRGTFEIQSRTGEGTAINIRIPDPAHRASKVRVAKAPEQIRQSRASRR